MKHTFFTLTLFLLALLSTSCGNKKVAYQNPLPMAFGDPFLLKASDGKYYMYGTGGVSNGFKVYSSDDLVTWTDEGPIYQGGTSDSWATDCFWAPEVYERDGKYYLWFSAAAASGSTMFRLTVPKKWRELTTILIADDVIPTVRSALRSKFARAKNTAQGRGAIRAQTIVELEKKKDAQIIESYGEVTVTASADDPTVCLVEFSFGVAHGLNQIHLAVHLTV